MGNDIHVVLQTLSVIERKKSDGVFGSQAVLVHEDVHIDVRKFW